MEGSFDQIQIKGPFWTAKARVLRIKTPAAPTPTLLLAESFSDFPPDARPGQWRETAERFSMQEPAQPKFRIFRFQEKLYFGTASTADDIHAHYAIAVARGWSNYTLRGTMRYSSTAGRLGVTFFSQFGANGKASYYRFSNAGSAATWQLQRFVDGNATANLGSLTDSAEPDQFYQYLIETEASADSTRIRIKLWLTGESEPDVYQLDIEDSAQQRLQSGTIGVWTRDAGRKYFGDFRVQGIGSLSYQGIRSIFSDYPVDVLATARDLTPLPGTKVAIVQTEEVDIALAGEAAQRYVWKAVEASSDQDAEASAIASGLEEGRYALLLLRSVRTETDEVPLFRCLNGHLSLDHLQAQDEASERLLQRLNLQRLQERVVPDQLRVPGALLVDSSGLALLGTVHLPWIKRPDIPGETIRYAAPFRLHRHFPVSEGSIYRLELDVQRFGPEETTKWIGAWRELSSYVNPRNPLNPSGSVVLDRTVPVWTTLELLNLNQVPALFWELTEDTSLAPVLSFPNDAVQLLLSNQQLYDEQNAATTIMQIKLERIRITDDAEGLRLELTAGSLTDTDEATLHYQAQRIAEDNSFEEKISVAHLQLDYDAVDLPRLLRNTQELPTPQWIPASDPAEQRPLVTPTLQAYMPLEEGWMELPVFNLTEQIYLDAQLDNEQVTALQAGSGFSGAVRFSNQFLPVEAGQAPNEQAWDLTLLRAAGLRGQLQLQRQANGQGFMLQGIDLQIEQPDLSINGLLWLSPGRPTLQDALPDLSNWVSGLVSVNLRSVQPERTLFRAPMGCRLQALELSPGTATQIDDDQPVYAALGPWQLQYEAREDMLRAMVDRGVLPPDPLHSTLPLLWIRDRSLPMVQALPLTQNQRPANFPAASRQLAPLQFPVSSSDSSIYLPDNWQFATAMGEGASCWLSPTGTLEVAESWGRQRDLPMVALSLPGLVFDPSRGITIENSQAEVDRPLLGQWRYDVPLTDQLQALAQLPKPPQRQNQLTPFLDSPPIAPKSPLTRATFSDYWTTLSNQAALAAADAIEAWHQNGDGLEIINLIEPLSWPVEMDSQLSDYPGQLVFRDRSNAQSILLRAEQALRGISGRFVQQETDQTRIILDSAAEGGFDVEGHSMSALMDLDRDQLRDQRGWYRSATQRSTGDWLLTRISNENTGKRYHLRSLLTSIDLLITDNTVWNFWAKDLPLEVTEDAERFDWTSTRSPQAMPGGLDLDINDPEAISRDYNLLQGYEWRLQEMRPGNGEYLMLEQLYFYPLRMDTLLMEAGEVQQLSIVGRLQLPLNDGGKEQENLNNAVRLRFAHDEQGLLRLSDAEVLDKAIEWPLAASEEQTGEVPRLCFDSMDWQYSAAGSPITLVNTQLKYLLFETDWTVGIGNIVLSSEQITHQFSADTVQGVIYSDRLELRLHFDDAMPLQHELKVYLRLQLGSRERSAFAATVVFPLLGPHTGRTLLIDPQVFGALQVVSPVDLPAVHYQERTLQVHWSDISGEAPYAFLPGIPLRSREGGENPGFATVVFGIQNDTGQPTFFLRAGFVEVLLSTTWGDFLQSSGRISREAAFQASAGALSIGYTSEYQQGMWQESFLLNGNMEVRNLITWPEALHFDAERWRLDVPTWQDEDSFRHLRHSIHILFNQHEIPATLLDTYPADAEGTVLFGFKPTMNWQFLAVCEHQILDVDAADLLAGEASVNPGQVTRWTALQEVRFIPPTRYRKFLQFTSGQDLDTSDGTLTVVDPRPLDADNPPTTVSIRGRILSAIGRGIPNLTVALHFDRPPIQIPGTSSVSTRADGRFEFPDIRTSLLQGLPNRPTRVFFHVSAPNGDVLLGVSDQVEWTYTIGEGELQIDIDFEAQPIAYIPPQLVTHFQVALDALPREEEMLIVEASAPHWIARRPLSSAGFTSLQTLPVGLQSGILSNPADYTVSDPQNPDWGLQVTPFIGRLQQSDRVEPSNTPGAPGERLTLDPVLQLYHHKRVGLEPDPLLLSLTNYVLQPETSIPVSPMDTDRLQRWDRLDFLSLESNWFRLANLPAERRPSFLQSVSASLADTAGRASRAAALQQAFIGERSSYPSRPVRYGTENPLPPLSRSGAIAWREGSLLVFDYSSFKEQDPGAALTWALLAIPMRDLLSQSSMRSTTDGPNRHAAATLLPHPDTSAAINGFSVSPYLGLQLEASAPQRKVRLISAELLGLDGSGEHLRPVASQLVELSERPAENGFTVDNYQEGLRTWAREVQARQVPDSAVLVLRLRKIEEAEESNPGFAVATSTYAFEWVAPTPKDRVIRQNFPLRATVQKLRFREANFGGYQLPGDVKAFMLAPPQTDGMQAIYYDPSQEGPEAGETSGGAAPWGLSTLRMSSTITRGRKAIVSDPADPIRTLWWQSVQQFVQFRSGRSDQPAAGLPRQFRGPAIAALQPALHQLPLPKASILNQMLADDEATAIRGSWQSFLPGHLRSMSLRSRAGVPFVYRTGLTQQRYGLNNGAGFEEQFSSGSIPVQHRYPRPVCLPPNDSQQPAKALRPWASFFTPQELQLVANDPIDTAFFAPCGKAPARGLRLILQSPERGTVSSTWDGRLVFGVATYAGNSSIILPFRSADWELDVALGDEEEQVRWQMGKANQESVAFHLPSDDEVILKTLQRILGRQSVGDSIKLEVSVRHVAGTAGFQQVLQFPLRIEQGQRQLPLLPFFVHFEDPEYNRRLASATASVGRPIRVGEALVPIRLSTDRKKYNPTGKLSMRYDWDAVERIGLVVDNTYTVTDPALDRQLQITYEPTGRAEGGYLARVRWIDPTDGSGKLQQLLDTFTGEEGLRTLLQEILDELQARTLGDTPETLATITFKRVQPGDGSIETLRPAQPLPDAGTLYQFDLLTEVYANVPRSIVSRTGEILQLELAVYKNTVSADRLLGTLVLQVEIVLEPVNPVPQAAYALLRKQDYGSRMVVDCPRFAWNPNASRIELVCPEDLLTQVVRRRAVLQLQDSSRPGRATRYAVQKTDAQGSTHFPGLEGQKHAFRSRLDNQE